jgi:hypothetical protein
MLFWVSTVQKINFDDILHPMTVDIKKFKLLIILCLEFLGNLVVIGLNALQDAPSASLKVSHVSLIYGPRNIPSLILASMILRNFCFKWRNTLPF